MYKLITLQINTVKTSINDAVNDDNNDIYEYNNQYNYPPQIDIKNKDNNKSQISNSIKNQQIPHIHIYDINKNNISNQEEYSIWKNYNISDVSVNHIIPTICMNNDNLFEIYNQKIYTNLSINTMMLRQLYEVLGQPELELILSQLICADIIDNEHFQLICHKSKSQNSTKNNIDILKICNLYSLINDSTPQNLQTIKINDSTPQNLQTIKINDKLSDIITSNSAKYVKLVNQYIDNKLKKSSNNTTHQLPQYIKDCIRISLDELHPLSLIFKGFIADINLDKQKEYISTTLNKISQDIDNSNFNNDIMAKNHAYLLKYNEMLYSLDYSNIKNNIQLISVENVSIDNTKNSHLGKVVLGALGSGILYKVYNNKEPKTNDNNALNNNIPSKGTDYPEEEKAQNNNNNILNNKEKDDPENTFNSEAHELVNN